MVRVARSTPLALVLALASVACKKNNAAADAGANADAGAPEAVAWDGAWASARNGKGIVAVVSSTQGHVGIVDIAETGRETARRVALKSTEPVTGPLSIFPLAKDALVVSWAAGAPSKVKAIAVGADRRALGTAVPIAPDACAIDSALLFIDPALHKLRRWLPGASAPREAEEPSFDPRASLVCGKRAAYVIEPRGSSFHVFTVDRGVRIPLVDGIDPAAGGASAFYTHSDLIGVVAVSAGGALVWTTLVASTSQPQGKVLARKLAAEQTIVAADGDAESISVLLQRDSRRRCKEEDAPPAYDLFEVAREGGKLRERLVNVPSIPCDAEASTPELTRNGEETIVRWVELKEGANEKQLRTARITTTTSEFQTSAAPAPTDVQLLDCENGCASVANDDKALRVIAQ